jgi:hypothetical protein
MNLYDLTHTVAPRCINALALAIIRTVLMLYYFAVLITLWQSWDAEGDRDSMRFFTHVSFLLLFVVMLTMCVLSWLRRPWREYFGRLVHEPAVPRGVIITVWIMWEVLINAALFLDIVYWALLADADDVENPQFINFMVHGGNFVIALIDFAINRVTIVPMHALFVYLYPVLYMVFAWIWFAARGEWIYGFVNLLREPIEVFKSYLGVIVTVGAAYLLLWILDRIKRCIFRYAINDRANDGIVALAEEDDQLSSASSSEGQVKLDLFSRAGVAEQRDADADDDPDALSPPTKKGHHSKKGRRHRNH